MGNSLEDKQQLYSKLRSHADLIKKNPQTNSVFRLAQDLFSELGSETTTPARLVELAQEIGSDLARSRAQRLREQHGLDRDDPWQALEDKLGPLTRDFDAMRAAIECPLGGLVFTAHPTFAYDPATYEQLAALSVGELDETRPSRPPNHARR